MYYLCNENKGDEQCRNKICLPGFRTDPTQTGMYNHRRWIEASNSDLGRRGTALSTPQPLYNTIVGVQANFRVS